MREVFKTAKMPKPYLLEVLGDYLEVEKNIGAIIDATGYKHEFIANKLDMPISTYYAKRRKTSFTAKDVFKIIKMLDDDEMYNKEKIELLESRKNDEVISSQEFKAKLKAMMKQ
jgi:predicted transcriptional regulator